MITFATPVVGTSPRKREPFPRAPAARLGPDERKGLALRVLARDRPVTHLAAERRVSRKFAYRQAAKASDALDAAFDPSAEDDKVLFHLPVTKKWIESTVVSLALTCHSSYRGVMEFMGNVLDVPVSVGTVHNVLRAAAAKARDLNDAEDISRIRVAAHDARGSGPSSGADHPGDIPGRKAGPRRGRRRVDLLLPSRPGRPPRRDDMGRASVGSRRARLASRV